MAFEEVFTNPTIKQVVFQIRFPNLFYVESKIGDFQLKIMDRFPFSSILTRRAVVVADYRSDMKTLNVENLPEGEELQKIWQFKDEKETTVNILSDSIDISSTTHKTYNNQGAEYKFRDVVTSVVDAFLQVVKLPVITRIGLRYIDECPIDLLTNDGLRRLYNSVYPYHRFDVADTEEMGFVTTLRRDDLKLRYSEGIRIIEGTPKMLFDFDGYSQNIDSGSYLTVLDRLHTLVANEFQNSIHDPIVGFMRTGEL